MKKSLALLAVTLIMPFLSSCQNEIVVDRVLLTYGTYLETSIADLPELDNDSLLEKVQSDEVFFLATHQGEYS